MANVSDHRSHSIHPHSPLPHSAAASLALVATHFYNRFMPIIEIGGLAKSYRVYQKKEGLLAAVRGLVSPRVPRGRRPSAASISTVEQGEFVAFLGPNGAGKTTTLKLLSGVIYPTARHGPRAGLRALEARERLSPPLRPGDGAEEPALVGPAGRRSRSGCTSRSTASSRREFERTLRRADRAARTCGSCSASRCASCRWASG